MPLENQDIHAMVEEANSEQSETSEKATRGQTKYIRQALIRIFRMSPEERLTYKPKNGWEEAALAHFNRCLNDTRGTAALNALRESIGESVSKQKATPEKKNNGGYEGVVDDLPRSIRKVQ
jgi:hypothetical protein